MASKIPNYCSQMLIRFKFELLNLVLTNFRNAKVLMNQRYQSNPHGFIMDVKMTRRMYQRFNLFTLCQTFCSVLFFLPENRAREKKISEKKICRKFCRYQRLTTGRVRPDPISGRVGSGVPSGRVGSDDFWKSGRVGSEFWKIGSGRVWRF